MNKLRILHTELVGAKPLSDFPTIMVVGDSVRIWYSDHQQESVEVRLKAHLPGVFSPAERILKLYSYQFAHDESLTRMMLSGVGERFFADLFASNYAVTLQLQPDCELIDRLLGDNDLRRLAKLVNLSYYRGQLRLIEFSFAHKFLHLAVNWDAFGQSEQIDRARFSVKPKARQQLMDEYRKRMRTQRSFVVFFDEMSSHPLPLLSHGETWHLHQDDILPGWLYRKITHHEAADESCDLSEVDRRRSKIEFRGPSSTMEQQIANLFRSGLLVPDARISRGPLDACPCTCSKRCPEVHEDHELERDPRGKVCVWRRCNSSCFNSSFYTNASRLSSAVAALSSLNLPTIALDMITLHMLIGWKLLALDRTRVIERTVDSCRRVRSERCAN